MSLFGKSKPAAGQGAKNHAGAARGQEPSYVAPDAQLEGNISTAGEIHIDGEVRGNIRAQTCLIDKQGQVTGSVSAQFVVVRGRVYGPITAQQLTIQKGAHVEGNVVHEGLSIENGAYLMGTVAQGRAVEAQPEAPSENGLNLLAPIRLKQVESK